MMRHLLAAAALVHTAALDDGLALTPPRGWRSWNFFKANITQAAMEATFTALTSRARSVNGVPTSLADLGYLDVGLDDGWAACKAGGGYHDAGGAPRVDATKFPDLGAMVAAGHARGLTVGWYANCCICRSNASNGDCADVLSCYAGDVAALRRFGFDSIKVDDCGAQHHVGLWADLLAASPGAPVLIENCKNGPWFPESYVPWAVGYAPDELWCPFHFFRTSTDISVSYEVIMGVNLASMGPWAAVSRPGCWAYGDILEVGVAGASGNLTFAEARAHFGAWCIASSPLYLGLDVRDARALDAAWPIIANTEALAVNSAWAGGAGARVAAAQTNVTWPNCLHWGQDPCTVPTWEVWAKPLPGSAVAVLALNHGADAADVRVPLGALGAPALACARDAVRGCAARDVWAHAAAARAIGAWAVTALPPHDSAFAVLGP
jgi:alpha-galactosidase